jgi:KDO2-lipid IV(A) lauroyltransferase
MRLQDITSSPPIIRLGLFISRHMPSSVGYGIASLAANFIAASKPAIYWTVRSNLSHAMGPGTEATSLHRLTREVFYHAAQTYYDYFHALAHGERSCWDLIEIPPEDMENLLAARAGDRGAVLVTGHFSNFDLAGMALAASGIEFQALSLRDPIEGFQLLNRMRSATGIITTPIETGSLRDGIRRLRVGGLVVTGVDRPAGDGDEPLEFFGATAYLPTGHIRLALKTDALLVIGYCEYDPQAGSYKLRIRPPMELVRSGDRKRDVRVNAQRVLAALEEAILAHPEQWLIFVPVWPQPDQ